VIQLLLAPLLALTEGLVPVPYQMPDADFGQAYSFIIPISNPNNIPLVFRKTAGEISPGIRLEEAGRLEGKPTGAGTFTFTITVLWNDSELAHHDYSLKVALPKVRLLDPRAAGVKLLPTATAPDSAGAPVSAEREAGHASRAASPVQADKQTPPVTGRHGAITREDPACCDAALTAPTPPDRGLALDQPLTTANDSIEGISATKDDVTIKRRGVVVSPKAAPDVSGHFSYALPSGAPLIPGEAIQACTTPSDSKEVCSETATVQPLKRLGEQTRMVLGFQQAGASGANSDQKFFFDFYISRPFHFGDNGQENLDARTRWWGNVRVASAPRQISSPVSTQALGSSLKSLKVNELAESAEFLTGLDFRLGQICCALWSQSGTSRERFALSFIVGGGATGPLKGETNAGNPVFQVQQASPDYARLVQMFPQAAKYPYLSFIPPSRNQYFAEYFGGFRLTTRYADKYATPSTGPPAMVAFTVGQNELVTGGHLRGAVGRVEAFFPLSTGRSDLLSSIYLFGNAQLRLKGPQNVQPFNLTDVATITNPMPAPGATNTVYLVTPSNRDIYSIGLGLDLVKILNSLNITIKTGSKQ
jgi:hypothetical protein